MVQPSWGNARRLAQGGRDALNRRILALGPFLVAALSLQALPGLAQSDAETRILNYIHNHLKPGQPTLITELYGTVFTKPEERKALDKLYAAFFRIPLFLAQYQERFGSPPSLKVVAEQFDLSSLQAADVLMQVMESDPRVPRFLTRDPQTGEITGVDVEKIRNHPRFGQVVQRQLSGWEGKSAPEFRLQTLAGSEIDSTALRGRLVLIYVWFTGCPPCMKQTPELVALNREFSDRGLTIVGANADRLLGLSHDDATRRRYAEEQNVNFPLAHWTPESDAAFGNIAIYPTLFLIGRDGSIVGHWVGYVSPEAIRQAVAEALEATQGVP